MCWRCAAMPLEQAIRMNAPEGLAALCSFQPCFTGIRLKYAYYIFFVLMLWPQIGKRIMQPSMQKGIGAFIEIRGEFFFHG